MSQIPFCGPTYQGRSKAINASRAINFFLEGSGATDDKTQLSLIGTPGTLLFATKTGVSTPVRAIYSFNSTMWAVVGNKLYSVSAGGAFTEKGTLTTSTGRVSIADNGLSSSGVGGDQLILVDGADGYIYNVSTSTFSTITDADFLSTPTHVTYCDGYFIVIDNTMRYVVSNMYDGTAYSGLAFAAVASLPDKIQNLISLNGQVFFIKEYTSEAWYNAGIATTSGSPFARISGAVFDYGTPAPWSVARGGSSIFFLSTSRTGDSGSFLGVAEVTGYAPKIISPPPISYKISTSTSLADCFGYCYADDGHMFYVLTNPTDDWTLVYDTTTQMWHERSSFDNGTTVKRHVGNCYTYHSGKHYIGDYRNASILKMSTDYYTDNGVPIHSIRIATHLFDANELNPVFISRLDLDTETGTGVSSTVTVDVSKLADGVYKADGSIPAGEIITGATSSVAYLSWSNDGGNTWSAEYPAAMGAEDEFTVRLVWRRLGYSRNRVFKLRIEDNVKRVILGAYIRESL